MTGNYPTHLITELPIGAQLLAVVVTIRAARGGVGNVTGTDLRSLRLIIRRPAPTAGGAPAAARVG
ncbi:hypothetical protein ACIOHC_41420 [Streptomyces sp. NPDC088252]|uniref:hypothetical protein n=1 Tax=unclassified Streptomyces TaxID=2593676 RepID=UPI00343638E0